MQQKYSKGLAWVRVDTIDVSKYNNKCIDIYKCSQVMLLLRPLERGESKLWKISSKSLLLLICYLADNCCDHDSETHKVGQRQVEDEAEDEGRRRRPVACKLEERKKIGRKWRWSEIILLFGVEFFFELLFYVRPSDVLQCTYFKVRHVMGASIMT